MFYTITTHKVIMITILTGIISAGCTNTVYQKPISSFSTSAQSLDKSFKEYQLREQSAVEDAQLALHLAQGNRLNFYLSGTCNDLDNIAATRNLLALKNAKDCYIQYTASTTGGEITGPFLLQQENPSAALSLELSNEIVVYSKALASIADSESLDELSAANTELAEAIGSLGNAVFSATEKEKDTSFSSSLSPVTALLNRLTVTYMNYRRNVALRDAVNAAHPLIENSAEVLSEQASIAHIAASQTDYVLARHALDNGFNASGDTFYERKNALLQNAKNIRAYAKTNPATAYSKLITSHKKLKDALNNPSTQLSSVYSEIKAFKDEVEEIQSLFDER